ncbi:hypothetical protein B0O99DRAFT_626293 [Bisporella sp. PMI_857]|nr:hypothetical protein B0O99DRAFT_626293 [Bisporella sp. PMI_857]
MRLHDSKQEVASIKKAIEKAAKESGVDRRLILAMIMQESSGNVRVPNTTSVDGVINTGLMQAHTGSSFDSDDSAGSIERMVRDGVEGTNKGDGILQCLVHRKGNTYEALREYNSGSLGVNREQLNEDGGGPNKYVQLVANRLMGHVWEGM